MLEKRKKMRGLSTTYHGVEFRSRLEARWAAFFDVLSVQYEYEPTSYKGAIELRYRYLPDFHLVAYDKFIEIKPFMPDEEEVKKAYAFAYYTGKPILIVYGSAPRPGAFNIFPVIPNKKLMFHHYTYATLKYKALRTWGFGHASQSLYLATAGKKFSYPLQFQWQIRQIKDKKRLIALANDDEAELFQQDMLLGIETIEKQSDMESHYSILVAAYHVATTANFKSA